MSPFTTAPRLRHLSVSSIQTYVKCPAAWKQRYVDGVKLPPPAPMAFGRAMSAGLEAEHLGLDGNAAFRAAHAELAREFAARGEQLVPCAEYGIDLLDLYREHGVYRGVPEQSFRLHLPGRDPENPRLPLVPVPIVGYLDLMADELVVEFKTSSARWTQERVDREYQAAVYAWAFRRMNGRRPRCVRYVVLSTATPALVLFETRPTGDDLWLFETQAAAVWRGIQAGKFDPCGKRSCDLCGAAAPSVSAPRLRLGRGRIEEQP